jgi:group I intron endonuclease
MGDNYCVYMHTAPNGKRYIGITCQTTSQRWRNGLGYRRNKHFFNAIMKYGWDNFRHTILADGLSAEHAKQLERNYIAKYRSFENQHGYNHTFGGDGTRGYKLSDEMRLKISLAHTQFCASPEARRMKRESNPNKKFVYQYSTDGILIKVWESARQAEKELVPGKQLEAIRKCCGGDCDSAYGYIWSYEPLTAFPTIQRQRKVYQYDKSFNLVKVWDSLFEAVNYFRDNYKSTVINQCVSGHRPHAYGFVWSYSMLEKEVS